VQSKNIRKRSQGQGELIDSPQRHRGHRGKSYFPWPAAGSESLWLGEETPCQARGQAVAREKKPPASPIDTLQATRWHMAFNGMETAWKAVFFCPIASCHELIEGSPDQATWGPACGASERSEDKKEIRPALSAPLR
jgi:hypothetical protein